MLRTGLSSLQQSQKGLNTGPAFVRSLVQPRGHLSRSPATLHRRSTAKRIKPRRGVANPAVNDTALPLALQSSLGRGEAKVRAWRLSEEHQGEGEGGFSAPPNSHLA